MSRQLQALATLLLIGSARAAAINSPGYLLLNTQGNISDAPATYNAKAISDDYDSVTFDNQYYIYTFDLEIGTPAQTVNVLIDTGSSDTWVMSPTNPKCKSEISCSSNSFFNSSASSSYTANTTKFGIGYGGGQTCNGHFFQDDCTLGSATIKHANLALVNDTDATKPIMGIGLMNTESMAGTIAYGLFTPTYDNLPVQLKKQGFIESTSYSLWLNDRTASTGNILFGAVDHSKYTGELARLPMIHLYEGTKQPRDLRVLVNSVKINDCQVASSNISAILDSGTSYTIMPADFVKVVADTIGYTLKSNNNLYQGPCSNIASDDTIAFNFQGKEIEMPLSYFISPNTDTCFLLIAPTTGSTFILGDVFLRSVYVVYDLDNYEIAMARAVYGSTDSDIELITGTIPSATQAPSYSATATGASMTLTSTCSL